MMMHSCETQSLALERSQPVIHAAHDRMRLLIVSPFDDDLVSLLEILSRTNSDLCWRPNCADAMAMLRDTIVPVMLCDRRLPDGTWQTLLARVNLLSQQPRFIVTARLADERLWAEALNLGAYDVLEKPFDAAEVVRVIGHACSSWRSERQTQKANTKSAASA